MQAYRALSAFDSKSVDGYSSRVAATIYFTVLDVKKGRALPTAQKSPALLFVHVDVTAAKL